MEVAPAAAAAAAAPSSEAVDMHDDAEDDGGARKKRRIRILTPKEEMKLMMSVDVELPEKWTTKDRDEITGEPLDEEAVRIGEEEEMNFIRKSNLYTKMRRSDVGGGTRIIPVRWIRVNKGTEEKPNIRCRLVAKEIKRYADDSLFAATPPLESLKVLVALAASKRWRIVHVDIKRAYFNAKALRDVYVELDEKDKEGDEEDMVGKLNYAMYGTRDAASSWEACYTEMMLKGGFEQGKFSPCVFKKGETVVTVHGDDFTITGPDDGVDEIKKHISTTFEVKIQEVDPWKEGEELIVLNRRIAVTKDGYRYEPDGKHTLKVLRELGLDGDDAKGSLVTGVKTSTEDEELRDRKLDEERSRWYRSVVATLNYMSLDRPDLGFAVKEVCRSMSSPSELDVQKLKKIGRFLVEVGNISLSFEWGSILNRVEGFSDSDFAGGEKRTSTSGGVIMFGGTIIKSWSKQQKVVALSSGEAELYGAVKLGCELIGIKSLARDFGLDVQLHMYLDAKATIGMLSRRGAGNMKHVETNQFWLQQTVASKVVVVHKVSTDTNFADILTKYLSGERIRFLSELMRLTRIKKSCVHRQ